MIPRDLGRKNGCREQKGDDRIPGALGNVSPAAGKQDHTWINRCGKASEHNAPIPCDCWLEVGERQAIIGFYHNNPLEGYRRLTFMMLDQNIVAVSAAST